MSHTHTLLRSSIYSAVALAGSGELLCNITCHDASPLHGLGQSSETVLSDNAHHGSTARNDGFLGSHRNTIGGTGSLCPEGLFLTSVNSGRMGCVPFFFLLKAHEEHLGALTGHNRKEHVHHLMRGRSVEACSARFFKTGGSDLALAFAKRDKNLLVSSDHRPPISPARTTKRARLRGPESSGYVLSFKRLAVAKTKLLLHKPARAFGRASASHNAKPQRKRLELKLGKMIIRATFCAFPTLRSVCTCPPLPLSSAPPFLGLPLPAISMKARELIFTELIKQITTNLPPKDTKEGDIF